MLAEHDWVRLNLEREVWLEVKEFERAYESARGCPDNSPVPAKLRKTAFSGAYYNQPLFCELLKSKDKIGSGGRDRTADLGVMNPNPQFAPISSYAKTQQIN